MSDTIEVRVPDIGDFKDVPVIEVLVKAGDRVKKNDSLITLESEKSSMEVPAESEGVVQDVKVKVGDKVSQGTPILVLSSAAAAAAKTPEVATASQTATVSSPPAASAAPETIEVRVPDIGDFKDVPVVEVLVKAGDRVKKNDSLITLESEKASMEVPAQADGIVQDVKVKVGDKVAEGTPILVLSALQTAQPAKPAAPPQRAEAPSAQPPAATGVVHAGPSVRRYARELGVQLQTLRGTGPNGRVTREDVQGFVKGALQRGGGDGAPAFAGLPAWPKLDFEQYGAIERRPLSRIKKLSGPNLHRNWVGIPHITNYDEADVTSIETLRSEVNAEQAKSGGPKLTMLAFLIRASVAALQRFPEFNASLDGQELILKRYYNIGFAADTPDGLIVPVIKNADTKGLIEIAREAQELAGKAREGKLTLGQMQGGSFTISSIGGIGGTAFTQIVNAPEVAILGATRAATKPVWDGKQFVPRLLLPISVSYDHRVVDGAGAARFLVYIAELLADFRRVML
jgi:pyruvate dehydrogenase E2 component (dihydrolipoamide acetyltransferase)